ncbi:MAG: hypothetical protein E6750_20615 [Atlantibacter hermannii]|uniref:hypothetical protein n=1 Tax=Atlantibacter hermannii TaxID=565 RepID=UPI0029014DC0|nr:hypothetical protein [Atlantibacter hermannii]MDU1953782.1 hypothetical protein [Atlantibacter hermannii]
MADTRMVTVGPTWQLIVNSVDEVTISVFRGHYGEICRSTGVPPETLDGHEIDYFEPELSTYRVSGEIYGRARTSNNQMKLIIT